MIGIWALGAYLAVILLWTTVIKRLSLIHI